MLVRCENKRASNYNWYGGKGITVCPEWHDFKTFLRDMGPRPKGYFLNRKDKDGPYSPDNCEWNSRGALRGQEMTAFGITCSVAEWGRRMGLRPSTIRSRLQSGWDFKKALTTPIDDCLEYRYALRMTTNGQEAFSKETVDIWIAIRQLMALKKKAKKEGSVCHLDLVKRKYDEKEWSIVI